MSTDVKYDELLHKHMVTGQPVELVFSEYPKWIGKARKEAERLRRKNETAPPTDIPSIPGYQNLEFVGHGNMGSVYRARQVSLNRDVAIKVMRERLTRNRDVERFRSEAESLARIKHDNIIQVHDFGQLGVDQCGGQILYIVMEYVEGETLRKLLNVGQVSFTDAAKVVAILARAIHEAHKKQIVHRDLKPENILFRLPSGVSTGDAEANGQQPSLKNVAVTKLVFKIADFGIARRIDSGSAASETEFAGTHAYMAPEQQPNTEPAEGPATDVYALGVILYEMLTGRTPFSEGNQSPSVSRLKECKVPHGMQQICLKCLEKEPSERYTGADQLAVDIELFLKNKPIKGRPVGALERCRLFLLRNRVAFFLIAFVSFIATVAIGGLGFNVARLTELEADNEKVQKAAQEMRARQQRQDYISEYKKAFDAYRKSNCDLAAAILDQLRPKNGEKDLRSFEWHYLHRLTRSELCHYEAFADAAFSPDGQLIGTSTTDRKVKILDWESGKVIRTIPGYEQGGVSLNFTQDGRHLVTAGLSRPAVLNEKSIQLAVRIWEIKSGRLLREFPIGRVSPIRIAVSPDGRLLASGTDARTVKVWNLSSGQVVTDFIGHSGNITCITFSPDGKTLASGSDDNTVRIWDIKQPKEIRCLKGHRSVVTTVSFGPNGRNLFSGSWDESVKVWDMQDGSMIDAIPAGKVTCLDTSQDGTQLAVGTVESGFFIWDMQTLEKTAEHKGRLGPIYGIRFNPHGQCLATLEWNRIGLWDMRTDSNVNAHSGNIYCLKYSPDGKYLASASVDGFALPGTKISVEMKVWSDVVREHEVLPISKQGLPSGTEKPAIAFSADSKYVAYSSSDGMAIVVRLADSKKIGSLSHAGNVVSLAFSPHGRYLACGYVRVKSDGSGKKRYLGEIKIWDFKNRSEIALLRGHIDSIFGLEFSPDGRNLVSASTELRGPTNIGRSQIKVWDWKKSREVMLFEDVKFVRSVAVSPDGRLFAYCGVVASMQTPRREVHFVSNGKIRKIKPKRGGWRTVVRLRELKTGKEVLNIQCDDIMELLVQIAFSPDGKRIAGAFQNKIRLWDTKVGQQVIDVEGGTAVAFSPDGKRMVGGFRYGTIRIWDTVPLEFNRNNVDFQMRKIDGYCDAGNFHLENGRFDQAQRCFEYAIATAEQLKSGNSEIPYHSIALVNPYMCMSITTRCQRLYQSSVEWHDKLLRVLHAVNNKYPDNPFLKRPIAFSYLSLGYVLYRTANYADAIRAWNLSEKWNASGFGTDDRILRSMALARAGDFSSATSEGDAIVTNVATLSSDNLVNLARVFAISSVRVRRSEKIKNSDRKRLEKLYTSRAIQLLGKAIKHGYSDYKCLEELEDFAGLRGLTEFKKLLRNSN